jgi:L-isoleucine 4-hydroxylase
VWLHRDDEPVVFVHLMASEWNVCVLILQPVDLTDLRATDTVVVGGDNIIAPDEDTITDMVRLEWPMESLMLGHKVLHAVTPMMPPSHRRDATRDILLVTFQEEAKAWRTIPSHTP